MVPYYPRPAGFVPRPADFNNFIPQSPPPKAPESAEQLEIAALQRENAALKQKLDVSDRACRISGERYTKWQASVHEVRHLTNQIKELEYSIKCQQVLHSKELDTKNYVHETERTEWASQIQQLTAQLESSSQETKDEIEAKHAKEIQALKTHLGEEYQKVAQKQRMDHAEKEKVLKASHSAEIKELEKAHNQSISQYAQMRQQMAGAYQNKINEVKAMTIKYEEEKKRADALQEFKKKHGQQQFTMIAPRTPNPTQNTPILPPRQQYPITVPGYTNPTQNNQIPPKAQNNLKRQQPHGEYQVPQNAPIRQRTDSYIPVQGSPQFALPSPPNGNDVITADAIQSAKDFLVGTQQEVSHRLKQAVLHRAMTWAQKGIHKAEVDAVLRDDPKVVSVHARQIYSEVIRRASMKIEDAPADMGSQTQMGVQNGGGFFVPGNQAAMPYNGAGFGLPNAENGM